MTDRLVENANRSGDRGKPQLIRGNRCTKHHFMKYKILEKDFIKSGWHFVQMKRAGDFAIYTKQKEHHKNPSFEIIHIQRYETYFIGGVEIKASESYPTVRLKPDTT